MEHLVAFEYGRGCVWSVVTGATAEEIQAAIPELDVYEEPPAWMTQEDITALYDNHRYEMNGSPGRLLDAIVTRRAVNSMIEAA